MSEMSETPAKDSPADAVQRVRNRRRSISLAISVSIIGCVLVLVWNSNGPSTARKVNSSPVATELTSQPSQAATGDYSKFSHENPAHNRLPCLLCHRRDSESSKPVRSVGHTPCAGCHAPQFAASSGPMCTICHVDVESGNRSLKPFPTLQSFNMVFAHGQHKEVGCATCHKPTRRGVAFSIPSGLDAHATCFKCHTARAQSNGRDISSCSTCHQMGGYSRTPQWTRAYKVSFSHAKHNSDERLGCLQCHQIRAGLHNEVTAPAPTEHFATRGMSCRTCHNNKRAFGEDFASCKRCHQGPTFRF